MAEEGTAVTARLEAASAVVFWTLLVLLLLFESAVVAPDVTRLVYTPATGKRTRIVTVSELVKAMSPIEQLTTPPTGAAQLPFVVFTSTKVEPAGSVSANVTPCARLGPLLSRRNV